MDPNDQVIKSGARESSATHIIEAAKAGRYTYCFGNQMSSVTAKSVSFNVHDMKRLDASSQGKEKNIISRWWISAWSNDLYWN